MLPSPIVYQVHSAAWILLLSLVCAPAIESMLVHPVAHVADEAASFFI